MAMLAEPRRKVKWTLNPRGKFWSEDANKFGQKMLEKMGWTSGKGLGANEQGITSHIHVEVKSDHTGVGFKGKDTEWCKHQSQFDDILKTLSQNTSRVSDHVPSKSLEDRSKSSKARLHYHKFTRGKDVAKYSSKDLECILGIQGEKSIGNCNDDSCKVEDIGAADDSFGVKTIVGGSVNDYLNQRQSSKWRAKAAKREDVPEEENGRGKKRKVGQNLKCEENMKDDTLEIEETRDPASEYVARKIRKKIKKLNCNKEGEVRAEVSIFPANADESSFLEGNDSACVVQVKKSGLPTCNGFDKEDHPEPVVEKGRREGKGKMEIFLSETKERLSLEEVGGGDIKAEIYISKNDIADEATGGEDDCARKKKNRAKCESSQWVECPLADGGHNNSGSCSAKDGKKGKSACVLEIEKSDHRLSIDENITVGVRNHSLISSVEDQVVVDDEVCSGKDGISRKVNGRMKLSKKKRSKESKIKPDVCYYRCINRREHDNAVLSTSCTLFSGGNLASIKGYGVDLKIVRGRD